MEVQYAHSEEGIASTYIELYLFFVDIDSSLRRRDIGLSIDILISTGKLYFDLH
jgi:hypothetical protein